MQPLLSYRMPCGRVKNSLLLYLVRVIVESFFAQPYRELQNYFESKEFHKAAKEMFREYDIDGSGYLDSKEILPILLEVWEQRKDLFKKNNLQKPTKSYAELQLKRFDTNKNGKLEEDEFFRLIKVTYASLSREASTK